MRILHTSDWHLGRSFGDHRLLDQQALFLDWLVEVVEVESIDLVAVAGDIFDRSVAPADAYALFYDTARRLLELGVDIAAIAGNHDSAERLGAHDGLFTSGMIVRGGYRRATEVAVRTYDDGPLAIVAMPFLDPAFAPVDPDADRRATHESVLRRQLAVARNAVPAGCRSLVLAHAFVTGAEPSDSERVLAVGDAAMVSAQVFDGFDYVALGHLHRAQTVAGDERIRYSGAPLPYSFGETSTKEVVIIELDDDGDARAKPLPIDVGRSVATVRGPLDELLAAAPNLDDWVRVELTDAHPVADAHRRLRDHFPYMIEISRRAVQLDHQRLTSAAVRDRSDDDLAGEFLRTVDPDVDDADLALLYDAVMRGDSP